MTYAAVISLMHLCLHYFITGSLLDVIVPIVSKQIGFTNRLAHVSSTEVNYPIVKTERESQSRPVYYIAPIV